MPIRLKRFRCISAIVGLMVVVAFLWLLEGSGAGVSTRAESMDPAPLTADYYAAINERFGVGLNVGIPIDEDGQRRQANITDYDVGALFIGWYSDWRTSGWTEDHRPIEPPGGIRYAQLITVRASAYPTNTLGLTETVNANPGALWIIGNEPEGKYGQGNRTPRQYAEIYHDVRALIKGTDPDAWIAIGGVIEPTPLRIEWLEQVLREYESLYGVAMPVDVWNIHVQILQEKAGDWGAEIPAGLPDTAGRLYTLQQNADPDIFEQLVTEFRQWMKGKGFQDKPLIISEYGVLMPWYHLAQDEPTGDQRVITFMRRTFDFLVNAKDPNLGYPEDDYRLVQQWLWYSLNDQPFDETSGLGFNGSLFSYLDPTRMTKFGAAFRDYMRQLLGYPPLPRILLPVIARRVSGG